MKTQKGLLKFTWTAGIFAARAGELVECQLFVARTGSRAWAL
jgi:hypothetical protein